MKKNKIKNSFTLVEVIIATSIIAIALVAVLELFPVGLKTENMSEMKTRAIGLAQAKIEEFYQNSYSEIKCGSSLPPCQIVENEVPEDKIFRRVTEVKFVNPQNNYSESSSDTGIKKVKVTIYWSSHFSQSEESFSITTLFANK